MLETPHVAVGAAIATKIPNPLISIPLAFASHFLLDKIPHWNPHLNTELKKFGKVSKNGTLIVAADVTLSLLVGGFFASTTLPNTAHAITVLLASFASVLPDVIEGPYFFLRWDNSLIKKWIKFQKSIQVDTAFVPGVVTQILTVAASFYWILG